MYRTALRFSSAVEAALARITSKIMHIMASE
jgi:hypothetical protein